MTSVADSFDRRFRGEVLVPGDDGFEEHRRVYNARIDARPRAIARCRGAADVIEALRVAKLNDLPVAVRGGGRHVAGYGTVEGGLVVDLGPMDSVEVDAEKGTVRFGGGARNRDLLVEAEVHGLAPVTGVVGHVGAAGLTLGGGIGWLGPRYGFSSDNVVSMDVVTPGGELIRVSADQEKELFWGMRGAGANFGIVVSFEVNAYPVPRIVTGGEFAYPGDRGPDVLRALREVAERASTDLYFFALYGLFGAEAGVPAEFEGQLGLTVYVAHLGDEEAANLELAPLRRLEPVLDSVGAISFVDLHLNQDDVYPDARQYWAAEHVPMTDETIAIIHDVACRIEDESIIDIYPWTGAMTGTRPDDGAFACRDNGWDVAALAQWTDPSSDDSQIAWAEDLSTKLRSAGQVSTGVYPNMVSRLGEDRLVEYFGSDRYQRLVALKRRWDPDNRLKLNANVSPGGEPD